MGLWLGKKVSVQSISLVGYLFLLVAVFSTVFFMARLGIRSILATVFIVSWTSSPYVVLGHLLRKNSVTIRKAVINCLTIFLVSTGGLYMLIDIMFIHPDPQGGIAVFMVPLFQFAGIGILCFISEWVH